VTSSEVSGQSTAAANVLRCDQERKINCRLVRLGERLIANENVMKIIINGTINIFFKLLSAFFP